MLDLAGREPATLALGIDASAAAMAEASRRAAGPARRGGRPNARFLVAAAEAPPAALAGSAGLVTVRFPWGSLLRGVLGLDEKVACGLASLVADGGRLEVLLAPSARDGAAGIELPGWSAGDATDLTSRVAGTFQPHGFRVLEGRPATDAEVRASDSTWARRLLAANGRRPADRSVVLVRLARS